MKTGLKPSVFCISISSEFGRKKVNVERTLLIAGAGLLGDIHGSTERPVSLLPCESFSKLSHPALKITPGDFAENIATLGLDFGNLRPGSRLRLGGSALIEVVQVGKECHNECEIRQKVGDCIMPVEGVFARVIRGGEIKTGNPTEVLGSL